jgi:hypothetical protein
MIARTRRRLLSAARALSKDGTVPPCVDDPGVYTQVRSGDFLADAKIAWRDAYEMQMRAAIRPLIGLGHRGLVGLVADVEFFGIDLEDRLAGDDRRPAYDVEHFLMVAAHAAARRSAVWIACHNRSAVNGMSRCSMPSSPSASTTALTSAGGAPWFTEGFDTSDLREAKALLDALNQCQTLSRPSQTSFAIESGETGTLRPTDDGERMTASTLLSRS